MAEQLRKGSLPLGWTVHVSSKYPNKVYYFNSITGDSMWECPKLNPPRATSDNEDKDDSDMWQKNMRESKSTEERSSEFNDVFQKSPITPTAVVAPVVQRSQKSNSPVQVSEKKQVKLKRKSDDNSPELKIQKTDENLSPRNKKNKKHISPLNKFNSIENLQDLNDDVPTPSIEMSEEEISKETSLASPKSENSIKDVEMRDVSEDILDDLSEKKETLFDTTACYYIVIDTNVLIRELDLISELKDTPLDGCGPPHIFIPWVVIEELDKLKNQKNNKASPAASEAIRYLNSVLSNHPRFHGQSPAEAESWAKTYSKCNDDKILECCIGLSDKMPPEKVVLLTNDKNLVNKALICKINVHNFESMIKKIRPDTKFNYGEMKIKKRRKRASIEKENEVSKAPADTLEERVLISKRDKRKCEIHSIMSDAHFLLKDVLYKFLSEEMFEAYGKVWTGFPIEVKLLKGLLEGILKYWRTVFYAFLTDKDKRNIELLFEKASRPEGFLGDKDECLVILSTVEEIFHLIQKRRPNLNVPVEQIQDYRVACVNAFTVYYETESTFRSAEDKSVRALLDDNWTVINQLCGIIMDHYKITHDFDYYGNDKRYSDVEIQRIMVITYPAVQTIKRLLSDILDASKQNKPVKSTSKKLTSTLVDFIPSLNLPYQPKSYPFFNSKCLEKWFTCPQNRPRIEAGLMQIKNFFSKLDEALLVIMKPS